MRELEFETPQPLPPDTEEPLKIYKLKYDDLLEIDAELLRIEAKNGPMYHSLHEAYGVMLEELDEEWRRRRSGRSTPSAGSQGNDVPHHYTRNTTEAYAWCNRCDRETRHHVSDGRLAHCLEHEAPMLTKDQQRRREKQEQEARAPKLF
jgi:hypothetical protein